MTTPSRSSNDSSSHGKVPEFRRRSFQYAEEATSGDAPASPESSSHAMAASPGKWFVNSQGTAFPILPGGKFFPDSLPIPHDAQYNKPSYFDDAFTLLLEEQRLRLWWEHHGTPQWEQAVNDAERAHARKLRKYRKQVIQIQAENQAILRANQESRSNYEKQLRDYERAKKEFADCKMIVPTRSNLVLEKIKRTVEAHRPVLAKQMERCHLRDGWKPCDCGYSLYWDRNWLNRNALIRDPLNWSSPVCFNDPGAAGEGWTILYQACPRYFANERYGSYGKVAAAYFFTGRILGSKEAVEHAMRCCLERATYKWTNAAEEQRVQDFLAGNPRPPEPPRSPTYQPLVAIPSEPAYRKPPRPQPPDDCYDTEPSRELKKILQGVELLDGDYLLPVARQQLFRSGELQRYYYFGGLSITSRALQVAHILLIGQSGSGKSTLLKQLLSYLLPLAPCQVAEIHGRRLTHGSHPLPKTSHEWSRDRTFQAVVYNAKEEFIPILAGFGFDPATDLIICDPADRRTKACNLAYDINDRDSIQDFVHCLIPDAPPDVSQEDAKFWKEEAHALVETVIVSFRRAAFAADAVPCWNLRDLINAFNSEEDFAAILQHHENFEGEYNRFVNVDPRQKDSSFKSVKNYLGRYKNAAARWAEAERHGQVFSLKEWALNGSHSVLVLPETSKRKRTNEPINQFLFLWLQRLFLDSKYSHLHNEKGETILDDNGQPVPRTRYLIFDELGSAGRLPQFADFMTKGRSFGVNVIAGLQLLAPLDETYGTKAMKSILSEFSYRGLLNVDDIDTQEAFSKWVGEQLVEWDKVSFNEAKTWSKAKGTTSNVTDGHATGKNDTWSHADTNGDGTTKQTTWNKSVGSAPGGNSTATGGGEGSSTNRSQTNTIGGGTMEQNSHQVSSGATETDSTGGQEGVTKGIERRKDLIKYPSEFGGFGDPAYTGEVGGVFLTKHVGRWENRIPFSALEPMWIRSKGSVKEFDPWPDDERVTALHPPNEADYERLHIAMPTLVVHQRQSTLFAPTGNVFQRQLADLRAEDDSVVDDGTPPASRFPSHFPYEDE